MSRETKEIITPNGHKVVMLTYLTGAESELLEDIWLEAVETKEGNPISRKETIRKGNLKLIEIAVVSVDTSSDNIAGRLRALKNHDYYFAMDELRKLNEPLEGEKKNKTV